MARTHKQRIVRRVVTRSNPVYKKSIFKKRIILLLSLVSLVLGFYGITYAYDKIQKEIVKNNFFNIKSINIKTSGKYITQNKIREQLEIKEGTNIFTFRKSKLEEKLRQLNPEIKDITITRWFPNIVSISIEERSPVGLLLYNSYLYNVDKDGAVFHKIVDLSKEKEKLPLFTGIKISKEDINKNIKNMSLLKAIVLAEKVKKFDKKFLESISEINVLDAENIILYTSEEGLKIKIGDTLTKEKITYINYVMNDIERDKAKYIDISLLNKAVVGY